MRMQVLGPVRAWDGDRQVDLGSAGQRALVGLLALAGGRPMSQAELVGALWAEQPPPSARNMIQSRIKHLRRALEPHRRSYAPSAILPMMGDGYALDLSGVDLDLSRFRRLVTTATTARQHGDLGRLADLLAEALKLWQGSPLADVPALASHPKVAALAEQRRTVLAQYGEALLAAGATVDAVSVLEETVADQPFDEALVARLIRAYQASGRRARAFAVYHEMRRRLADELGLDPGPELAAAHAGLLRDGPPSSVQAYEIAPVTTGTRGAADAGAAPAVVAAPRRPKPAQLPADVAAFTGRAEQLSHLDELMHGTPAMAIAVLSGTAGVGKTALAVHWAHRARHCFPDGQLYVNLRGFDLAAEPLDPAEVLHAFLDAFGVPARQVPGGLAALSSLYRSVLAGKRVLLVLDNARDAGQVRPLLPGTPGSLVVVTSRNRLASLVAAEAARPLAVDLLSAAESYELVAARLGADRVVAEMEAVREIADRCARLPLALAVVAARAASDPDLPLAELARQLRGVPGTLDLLAGEDTSSNVWAAFALSYHALDGPAATLFRLLGLLSGREIGTAAVASFARVSTATARSLLGELARAHLIAEPAPGRYRMHDLLRVYAAELANTVDRPEQRHDATGRRPVPARGPRGGPPAEP